MVAPTLVRVDASCGAGVVCWEGGGAPAHLVVGGTLGGELRITTTYTCNLLNDGHLLTLGLPLPPHLRDGELTLTVTGVPLSCVTSPTHGVVCTGEGMFSASLVPSPSPCDCIRHQPSVPGGGVLPPFFLGMLEPVDVGVRWEGLRGDPSPSHPCLPPGLSRLVTGAAPSRDPPGSPTSLLQRLVGGKGGCAPATSPSPSPTALSPPTPAPPATLHIPPHIAIVMDGNGRWAGSRGLPRSAGHAAGVAAIHRVIRSCRRLGVRVLTLYAFSSQNWSRPVDEVASLMALLGKFVATDCEELVANGVRLLVNGEPGRLPSSAAAGLDRLVAASAHNTGLTLCLALSYGGREEIAAGVAAAAADAVAGAVTPADLATPSLFRRYLPHPTLPDPDLLVRTSGEMRLSNFLLWHVAYTELWVTDVWWPDFDELHLMQAIASFSQRERRFGLTGEQVRAGGAGQAQAGAAHRPSASSSTSSKGWGGVTGLAWGLCILALALWLGQRVVAPPPEVVVTVNLASASGGECAPPDACAPTPLFSTTPRTPPRPEAPTQAAFSSSSTAVATASAVWSRTASITQAVTARVVELIADVRGVLGFTSGG